MRFLIDISPQVYKKISRNSHIKIHKDGRCYQKIGEELCKALLNMTPFERMTWQKIRSGDEEIRAYSCSNCGSYFPADTYYFIGSQYVKFPYHYCPVCGREMEVEE